jgi:hypothetical protein
MGKLYPICYQVGLTRNYIRVLHLPTLNARLRDSRGHYMPGSVKRTLGSI